MSKNQPPSGSPRVAPAGEAAPAASSPQPQTPSQPQTSDESAAAKPAWADGYGGVVDRRLGIDRRVIEAGFTGLERRRGAGRRLSESQREAEEGRMTKEQFLFLVAVDEFKKANQTQFPTWTDVLEVIRLLGYRKTCSSELNLRRAEDWLEPSNAPSNVRPPRWAERFETRKRPAA
jgi:hypothetical protein